MAGVPDDAEELRVWAVVLQPYLESPGKVVLLDKIDSGLDEERKDIPLFDGDLDLVDVPDRQELLRFCNPDTLDSAEAYWRAQPGGRITVSYVIEHFPTPQGEDDKCEEAENSLYLLGASCNIPALQFIRKCTLSHNWRLRSAATGAVDELLTPAFSLRGKDVRAYIDEVLVQRRVTRKTTRFWEIKSLIDTAEMTDVLGDDIVEDFVRKNFDEGPRVNAADVERIDRRLLFDQDAAFRDEEKEFDWDKFHKKYGPESKCVWISRVGYDPRHEYAIVYIHGDELILLKQSEGRWTRFADLKPF